MRMTASLSRWRRFLALLSRDTGGVALTEFAFAAPVLATLGVAGLETAQLAIANLRVTQMAAIVADSASRIRDRIDEADVDDIMTGAKLAGTSIKFPENGRIILSSLELNAAGNGQWIRWQRCDGAKNVQSSYGAQGKGETDATLPAMGPAGRQIAAPTGTAVMFVEIVYDYQPLVSNRFVGGPRTIRTNVAFNVRQRTDQALTNTGTITGKPCTLFRA